MAIYEASIVLPPVNDLYSWRVLVESSEGSVESCTHKTMVIFTGEESPVTLQVLEEIVSKAQTSGACPITVNESALLNDSHPEDVKLNPLAWSLVVVTELATASLVTVFYGGG